MLLEPRSSRTATRSIATARSSPAPTAIGGSSGWPRRDADADRRALAGQPFNSPNDLVVKRDGTIWFTDPPYGIRSDDEGHQADSEIGDCLVFRFDPRTGALDPVTDWVDEPNGLAFSPDESILYVSDTSAAFRTDGGGNHHIVAFDVLDGRSLRTRGSSTRSTNGSRRLPRRRRGQRLDLGATTGSTSWPPTGGGWAGSRSRR